MTVAGWSHSHGVDRHSNFDCHIHRSVARVTMAVTDVVTEKAATAQDLWRKAPSQGAVTITEYGLKTVRVTSVLLVTESS